MTEILLAVYLGLPTAAIALTLTRSSLTAGLRRRWHVLGCPYCAIHWVAAFTVAIGCPPGTGFIAFWLLWAAVVCIAAIYAGVVQRLWLMQEQELTALQQLLKEMMK